MSTIYSTCTCNKHILLLQDYDCTEQPVANQPAQPSDAGGSASANAGAPPPPPPARVQDVSSGDLVLPQLNRLHEACKRRQDALPVSSTSQDQQPTASGPIPSQWRLTQQLITHWPQFKALRQRYAGMRFEEQLMLHMPQKHKSTVPDSTLRMEMKGLESKLTTPRPASFIGSPSHRRDHQAHHSQ